VAKARAVHAAALVLVALGSGLETFFGALLLFVAFIEKGDTIQSEEN
jgi:hypothetical protein